MTGPEKRRGREFLLPCRCRSCRQEHLVLKHNLLSGRSRACGACSRQTHRHAGRRGRSHEYESWSAARYRATCPTARAYKDYGGRGITMCRRWRDSFAAFLADMGTCPAGLTLERKNNDRGYTPANCRWADRRQQARNTRRSRRIACRGRRQCLAAWSAESGTPTSTIAGRLARGWPAAEAIFAPSRRAA